MTGAEERAFINGNAVAWEHIQQEATRRLGEKLSPEQRERAYLLVERSEVQRGLRKIARRLGANDDWPEDLHLVDVLERLERALDAHARKCSSIEHR